MDKRITMGKLTELLTAQCPPQSNTKSGFDIHEDCIELNGSFISKDDCVIIKNGAKGIKIKYAKTNTIEVSVKNAKILNTIVRALIKYGYKFK